MACASLANLCILSFGTLSALQVDGCDVDLSEMKPYFRRSKICPGHQTAAVVLVAGQECRFCQQCTRCHPLTEFDGTKRSVYTAAATDAVMAGTAAAYEAIYLELMNRCSGQGRPALSAVSLH